MNLFLSHIKVEGDPNAVDSFAACICAIAKALSVPADYWYVEGLTGTSFSPCLNKGEDCIGWMVDGGNWCRYEFLGSALGLSINKIELAPGAHADWIDVYKNGGKLPSQAKTYFGAIERTLHSSGAVLCGTWPAWSVLTGWNDDLAQLPFSTTSGFESPVAGIYPPLKTTRSFLIIKTRPATDTAAIIRAAVKCGASVASEKSAGNDSCFGGDLAFGGALYDRVIEILRGKHLCPGCSGHPCFGRMIKRINNGHATSASFLAHARKASSSKNVSAAFDKAIESYADMQAISGKYLDWASYADSYDKPAFRTQLAGDFASLKKLHGVATAQLDVLVKTM